MTPRRDELPAAACLRAALRAARELPPDERDPVLSLLASRVELRDDAGVTTAAMRRHRDGHYSLAVAGAFLKDHVRSDGDALFVLLHELLHRVLGHLHPGDGSLAPGLENLLCDMYVNAAACDLAFPSGAGVAARFYDPPAPPTDLLLAPAQLLGPAWRPVSAAGLPAHPASAVRSALEGVFFRTGWARPALASRLYCAVWFDREPLAATSDPLLELVRSQWPGLDQDLTELRLLGEHDVEEEGDPSLA